MVRNTDFLALTPLDHIIAKIYLPYLLHFKTTDSKTALTTIENGINRLVAHIPWLAGDVILRSEPDGPRNKGYIAFSSSSPEATSMLQVKRFGRHEVYYACQTREYLPVPCFIPASQQCPVLRFQANVFPSRIVLVMSFSHFALDGTVAGTGSSRAVLQSGE